MKNNIFEYATSELSQDAIICWCVNWINDKNSCLYPMAIEIMKKFGITEELDNIAVDIKRQFFKIDILLVIKGQNKVIIIEDKTDTSEHGNQIECYREVIRQLSTTENNEFDHNTEVTTVYFKTGFFDDYDKMVKADFVIQGKTFLEIIKRYQGNSEILDSYVDYLNRNLALQEEYKKYSYIENDNCWQWNISKHQITQYYMMRDIFPAEQYWDGKNGCYQITHGVNRGGVPWTELVILIREQDEQYAVFWRIDTNSKGVYISLRFYNQYNKQDSKERDAHINTYNLYRNHIEKIINEDDISWQWDDVKVGFTGNYYETSLMTFYLKDALKHWDTESTNVIQNIRKITAKLIAMQTG